MGGVYIGLGEESRKEGEGELWEGDHGRENRKERERWRWRQKEKEGVEIGKREIRKGREYSRGGREERELRKERETWGGRGRLGRGGGGCMHACMGLG